MLPPEETTTITSADGSVLHLGKWMASKPRGVLIIAHGLGEHGGNYDHVARDVRDRAGLNVVAVDFRGHGRSAGARGYVSKYEDFLDDLHAVMAYVKTLWPGLKVFVLGHSNGGQIVLRASVAGVLDVAGIILSNPALRLAAAVPRWKVGVGKMLDLFAPKVTLAAQLDLNLLMRDPVMIEARRTDPLRHSRINSALFFGMRAGGDLIHARAHAITLPVLFLLGGADPIIDPTFTEEMFKEVGSNDKTLWIDREMLHEPLNELGREVPIGVLIDWINARAS